MQQKNCRNLKTAGYNNNIYEKVVIFTLCNCQFVENIAIVLVPNKFQALTLANLSTIRV